MRQAGSIPAERVERALDDVLSRPEFGRERTLLDEALEWLEASFGTGSLDLLGGVLRWAFAALLVGLLVWFGVALARALRARAGGGDGRADVGSSATARARELVARARAARDAGDLRLALRLYLFALLLGTAESGDLVYRDAWTNRELLRRGRPSERVRGVLADVVDEFEPKEFGRAAVAPADLARLEELVTTHVPDLGARA